MKTLLISFLVFLCASAPLRLISGPIYQFNPVSPYVTNRGVTLFWGNTTDYQNRTNYLVNATNMPAGIPIEFTKLSNGFIRAVTTAESNLINTLTASNQNYFVTNAAAIAAAHARTNAIANYDALDAQNRFNRALVKLIVDELNIMRTNPVAVLSARTYQQARTAITNAIAADQ